MSPDEMTSLQRVLATLSLKEPDRVPLFLLPTVQGATEMGVPLRDYFHTPSLIAEAQVCFRERYRNDCLYGFSYAAAEFEAFGGDALFYDCAPPNAGAPVLHTPDDFARLAVPKIEDWPALCRTLELQAQLRRAVGGDVPVIGVVMSPVSLPVMQLGFPAYLRLLMEQPESLTPLFEINEEFCVAWANAQLAAGADALVYYDPVGSCTIIEPAHYRRLCAPIAKRVLARIKGPTATHFASGRSFNILQDVVETGTGGVVVSGDEDLAAIKAAVGNRLPILGNLNGLAMRHWDAEETERQVKNAIAAAGVGGGFILTDHHGEIPFDVPERVLIWIAESVERWGRYPLTWVDAWRAQH
ncbi:MAG: uroporphyrinogen decarboxylase family protein [Nitrosomonadales bacterium]|nr:uroporphyrinogen decarboxylase family protein [Nitrosomonadales bacterium]